VEKGGPELLKEPEELGFGSLLARNSIEAGLEGNLAFDWRPEGLVVRISVSLARIQA
jgi:two-component sensor histidine kinase